MADIGPSDVHGGMTSDERKPVVATSDPERERSRSSPARVPRVIPLPLLVVLVAVLLPATAFLVASALIIVANNLDVAYALGVPDDLVTGVMIGGAGLATGLVVALASGPRGWRLLSPPVAGLLAGVGIYLGFVAFEPGAIVEMGVPTLVTIGTGQLIAIVASTRTSGLSLATVLSGVVALGVVFSGLIQAIPPAPAEVLLVLDVYETAGPEGECSGAGELAGVEEGSEVILFELPEVSGMPTEVGSVALGAGMEKDGGCRFELGNPLDLPAESYANIDFLPESDPDVPYSIALEGNHVVVHLEHAEG